MPGAAVRSAAGDVCTRFYDDDGEPIDYPGLDRQLSIPLEVLRKVPVSVAVAVGHEKVRGIIAGARAGYVNELVTDIPTASALVVALKEGGAAHGGR